MIKWGLGEKGQKRAKISNFPHFLTLFLENTKVGERVIK